MLFKQFPRTALSRLSSTNLHIAPRLLTYSHTPRMATKDACGAAPGTHATHKPLPKEEVWKYRPPYLIQSPEDFGEIKWRGKCHCGQISYSLNMERPLKAKFCHCRGCQLMHGISPSNHIRLASSQWMDGVVLIRGYWGGRRTLPMGRHIPQIQHNIRPGRARAGILLFIALHARIRSPSKGIVFVLPDTDYG